MRILVTGSRSWDDPLIIKYALLFAVTDVSVTLVSGGARGADRIAEMYARRWGWEVEQHLPDWERYGKAAGIKRNIEMVQLDADICLAFIKDNSKGATQAASYADMRGIPTFIERDESFDLEELEAV